jgi:phosphatidylethanolamine-binding protein (PEBP) family uncharacterized protein
MARPLLTLGTLTLIVMLGGCADAHHPSTTAHRPPVIKQQEISLQSPVLGAGTRIPVSYSCNEGIWLPLRWGSLPADTRELVLYLGGYSAPRALSGGTTLSLITANSLIVGLKPTLHKLQVGELPAGARVLVEHGVPSCPPRLAGREMVFKLYALPHAERISSRSLSSGSLVELMSQIDRQALGAGILNAAYAPR